MDSKIKKILEELYLIDGGLKAYEKDLEKIIAKLIESRPGVKLDREFALRLRNELLRAGDAGVPAGTSHGFNFRYALGAGLIVLLLGVSLSYKAVFNGGEGYALRPETEQLRENAFGPLVLGTLEKGAFDAVQKDLPPADRPAASVSAPRAMTFENEAPRGAGVSGEGMPSVGMIHPDFYPRYKLVYAGEPLELQDASGIVLRRNKGFGSSKELASFISKSGFGLINMSAFSAVRPRNIDIYEDREYGYAVNVNFEEGIISINPNWGKWHMEGKEIVPLRAEDLPPDHALVSIAEAFLKKYGIGTAGFGAPFVDRNFPQIMPMAAETSPGIGRPFYAPPQIIVKYPLILNGSEVYDEGGNVAGLEVAVDVSQKKVWSVSNLTSQAYQGSEYALETDFADVLSVALRGGVYGYSIDPGGRIEEVELGTPKRAYMRHSQYKDGRTDELFVPALVFPVQSGGMPHSYQKNIVVPLVIDLLRASGNYPKPAPEKPGTDPQPPVSVPPAKTPAVALRIRDMLSQELGIDMEKVEIAGIEPVDWPDSCLGMPADGEACAQVITAGYRIVLAAAGTKYEYHTDLKGLSIRLVP